MEKQRALIQGGKVEMQNSKSSKKKIRKKKKKRRRKTKRKYKNYKKRGGRKKKKRANQNLKTKSISIFRSGSVDKNNDEDYYDYNKYEDTLNDETNIMKNEKTDKDDEEFLLKFLINKDGPGTSIESGSTIKQRKNRNIFRSSRKDSMKSASKGSTKTSASKGSPKTSERETPKTSERNIPKPSNKDSFKTSNGDSFKSSSDKMNIKDEWKHLLTSRLN